MEKKKKDSKGKENSRTTMSAKKPKSEESLFGYYDIPLTITKEEIALSVERQAEQLVYKRESPQEKKEKILLSDNARILINPVEPLNKPKEITPYFCVDFQQALMVEPKISKVVFLSFPIEIGVFISGDQDFEIFDVFTLTKSKFTLYGDPRNGVICKCWDSDVYPEAPLFSPLRQGVLSLKVINTTSRWQEVTKAVFNAYGMKIYYTDTLVSMKANMRIMSKEIAETDFVDSPFQEGMEKSLELYAARKIIVTTSKYIMEAGI